jgi:hypothetical protein
MSLGNHDDAAFAQLLRHPEDLEGAREVEFFDAIEGPDSVADRHGTASSST